MWLNYNKLCVYRREITEFSQWIISLFPSFQVHTHTHIENENYSCQWLLCCFHSAQKYCQNAINFLLPRARFSFCHCHRAKSQVHTFTSILRLFTLVLSGTWMLTHKEKITVNFALFKSFHPFVFPLSFEYFQFTRTTRNENKENFCFINFFHCCVCCSCQQRAIFFNRQYFYFIFGSEKNSTCTFFFIYHESSCVMCAWKMLWQSLNGNIL